MMDLPINSAIPEIIDILSRRGRVVVAASTGSGKTTVIPQAILDSGLAGSGQVIVVQPRRVVARAAARFVAGQRGTSVGDEVGYWIRFDQRMSIGTRLTYVTEGILLRLLQESPELHGIGALVFDEFHERTVMGDAALALAKALQSGSRPDLRLVVMSATLDVAVLSHYLSAESVVSHSREHPVKILYTPDMTVLDVVKRIQEMGTSGDVLVFQPGKAEIAACIDELEGLSGLYVLPLHGELSDEEQDRIFDPAPDGLRKVIVATNIAETSITVPGIVFVIDTGTERVEEFNYQTGIGGLFLRPISLASADQRAGRAGRTAPGVCFRLWSESEHQKRHATRMPEIKRTSLAGTVLLLKGLGVRDVASIDFLDHPGAERIRSAEETLYALGALDAQGNLTAVGYRMQALPVEPHLGRMLVEAERLGCITECCTIAALGSVRNIFLRPKEKEITVNMAQAVFRSAGKSDHLAALAAYDAARQVGFDRAFCDKHFLNQRSLIEARDIRAQLFDLLRHAGVRFNQAAAPAEAICQAVAAGYVDSLWQRSWVYYERDGQSAILARESALAADMPDWIVAGEVRQIMTRKGMLNLITQATAVDPFWLCQIAPHLVEVRYEHHHVETCTDNGRSCLRVIVQEVVLLNGTEIARHYVPYIQPDATRMIAEAIARLDVSCEVTERLGKIFREIEDIRHRNPDRVPDLPVSAVANWYEARLDKAVVPVDDVPMLTDDDVSELLGIDWPTVRRTIRDRYPDVINVRGYSVHITYRANEVLVSVPPELVSTLTWRDLPELSGRSVRFTSDGISADSLDGLRVKNAQRYRRVSLPDDFDNLVLLSPIVVTHPDGRHESAGWLALNGDCVAPFETLEEAERCTRKTLVRMLVDALPEVVTSDLRLADRVEDLRRGVAQKVVDSLDLRQLDAATWKKIAGTMDDPASDLVAAIANS